MDIKLPENILDIFTEFRIAGFQLYIVGGAVRDLLMGRQVKDWDFTTDAKPEEILKLFPQGFYDNQFGTVGVPLEMNPSPLQAAGYPASGTSSYQTIHPRSKAARYSGSIIKRAKTDTVSRLSEAGEVSSESTSSDVHEPDRTASEQSEEAEFEKRNQASKRNIIEITTMRKEGDYKDHRHPGQLTWTTKIEDDLARRDFTINAIALGFNLTLNTSQVTLIDPFHGQDDIKKKLIRAVGDPDKRFREDALRLIRAVRIASELGFSIDQKTLQAIKKNAALISEIAWERIRDELLKLLASSNPYPSVVTLRETGILQIILPELERCFGIMQEGPKHDRVYDIGEHSLLALQYCPSTDPLVRFSALLHDIGKPDTFKTDTKTGNVTFYNHDVVGGRLTNQITKKFNFSNKQSEKIYRLVRWHMFSVSEHQTDSAIRRFIKNVGPENIDDMMSLRIGDRLGGGTEKEISWRMQKFRERIDEVLTKPFSLSDLKISGSDIMETLNIQQGPKIGELLDGLFEEVLQDASKNDREYLLKRAGQLYGKNN